MQKTCRVLIAIFLIALFENSEASTIWKHKLTVAANPDIGLDNAEVDGIIKSMNSAIKASTYGNPWDPPCPQVEFVREGNVVNNKNLPTTGSFEQLETSLKKNVPNANVLVVYSIDCDGINAAGCGRVGQEPLIIGLYPSFDDQLWLHERGHNLGLNHSAEAPASDDTVLPQVGMRFMFWRLGVGHLGKISSECSAFMAKKFSSIEKSDNAVAAVGAPTGIQGVKGKSEISVADLEIADVAGADIESKVKEQASSVGLSKEAYKVVGPPWIHGIPLDAIRALGKSDIDSIRNMLKGPVNQYWPQAASAVAIVGDEKDAALIRKVLDAPVPAVAPNASGVDKNKYRNFVKAKLSAPIALGILANRTKSVSLTNSLKDTAQIDRARNIIGESNAESLSRQAVHGLSIANTAESSNFIDSILKNGTEQNNGKVVPLSLPDKKIIQERSFEINTKGLDSYLKKSTN